MSKRALSEVNLERILESAQKLQFEVGYFHTPGADCRSPENCMIIRARNELRQALADAGVPVNNAPQDA